MRKLMPLLLASAGLIAIVGVMFLLIRTDALPARVRTLRWRIDTTTPAPPVEDEAV